VDAALLIARLLVAAVFLLAGAAKLADRAGSRRAVIDFGVPVVLASPLGLLLPLAELAVAAALVSKATAWWGALGALALLGAFVAAIAMNLSRGRKPDCRCFGQLHSSPAGWQTLTRNVALAGVAGFVVAGGHADAGLSASGVLADLTIAQASALASGLVLLALLVLAGRLLVNLLRQNGRLLLRIDALEKRLDSAGIAAVAGEEGEHGAGLPVGSVAPGFNLPGLYGEVLTLDALRAAGRPVALIFADPGCGPCNALIPEIGLWQRTYAADLTIALLSRGDLHVNRAKYAEHGLTNVLLQRDRETATAYEENGTPSAVLVRPDGTIGSPLANGAVAIQALIDRAVGAPTGPPGAATAGQNGDRPGSGALAPPPPAPQIGEPSPPVKLPDLNGHTVNLAGFRGTKTLLLFWNPGCGFCQQMLDELRSWEDSPPEGAPKLLIVSTGTREANEGTGLRSPILLDTGFGVASSFGANGTPMGVLIDEEGRIASEVAAGAPAVMALARAEIPALAG
jgi:peroxiredoxin/uncharacterized membrane protein YphA (DoxX/SURF4 family)